VKKRLKLVLALLLLSSIFAGLFWFFYVKVAYTPYGSVRSDWVEVSPRIDGYIDKVLAATDTHVNEGDLIMTIYSYPFELSVRQLKAELETEEAELAELKTSLADTEAQLEIMKLQLDLMRQKKERNEKLNSDGSIVSLDAFQTVWISYQQTSLANADLLAQKNNLEKKIDVQAKTIDTSRAKLAQAEYDLSQTKITAPFSGWITNNYVMPGQYCKAGDALCGLRGDKCWIEMNYKECYIGRIRPGMKAYLQTDIYPFTLFSGKVSSVICAVNRNDSEDMTLPYVEPTIDWVRLQYRFTVRIDIDKMPEGMTLRMGANARALIPLDQ